MDLTSIPFNNELGLTIAGESVQLPPEARHLNHLGTVHAAVVYAIAETAAGISTLLRFPELAKTHVAVLRGSTAKYRRPAVAGDVICGVGSLDENAVPTFEESLKTRGRATLETFASVSQNDVEVFTGKFTWFVSAM